MTRDIEQALNKAFEDVKIQSTRAGTHGRFGVYWDVKNGRPTIVGTKIEETKLIPQTESK